MMPATDAGVRLAGPEGTGAQQIQTTAAMSVAPATEATTTMLFTATAAVSVESAEASLMTMLPTKAVLAPTKQATTTTLFMAAAPVGVRAKAVQFAEAAEASAPSQTGKDVPASEKEKLMTSGMSAGVSVAAIKRKINIRVSCLSAEIRITAIT
jgi:hypothetical protein